MTSKWSPSIVLRLALAACALLASVCAAAAPPQVQYLDRRDGSSIGYYLRQADSERLSDSLLVVVQGSDCNSVTKIDRIEQIARALPQSDLLTVEKYGIDAGLPYSADVDRTDCPAVYLQHDRLSQRVADLKAVISHLSQANGYRKVAVIGGSEGAVIANMLAASGAPIHAVIAFNGGGRFFLDDVLHSIRLDPSLSAAARKESVQGFRGFAKHVMTAPEADLVASAHGVRWWQEVLRLDQLAVLRKTKLPVLIMQGEADSSVSPAAVTGMITQLRRAGRSNVHYKAYPGLDHGMQGADGASQLTRVVDDMRDWLGAMDPSR